MSRILSIHECLDKINRMQSALRDNRNVIDLMLRDLRDMEASYEALENKLRRRRHRHSYNDDERASYAPSHRDDVPHAEHSSRRAVERSRSPVRRESAPSFRPVSTAQPPFPQDD